MASSLYGDAAPLLGRPDLDGLLASDLDLGALATEPPAAHIERERRRIEAVLREGGRAFASQETLALLRPLAWDTDHFGVSTADLVRIYGDDPPGEDVLAHVIDHAARARLGLLYARCRADRPGAAHALEAAGFRWMDTSVELGKRLGGGAPAPAPDARARVREAAPSDVDALRPIAREFRRNRFHFDPRIPARKAEGVYEAWVASAARGDRGERLVVVEEDGAALGLSGYRAPREDDPLRVATLTLIAVAPEARGRGLFDALAGAVEARARRDGARYLVTSTQVHNARSLRAFARVGLRPYGARHVFHRWSA